MVVIMVERVKGIFTDKMVSKTSAARVQSKMYHKLDFAKKL